MRCGMGRIGRMGPMKPGQGGARGAFWWCGTTGRMRGAWDDGVVTDEFKVPSLRFNPPLPRLWRAKGSKFKVRSDWVKPGQTSVVENGARPHPGLLPLGEGKARVMLGVPDEFSGTAGQARSGPVKPGQTEWLLMRLALSLGATGGIVRMLRANPTKSDQIRPVHRNWGRGG
jgi:hypothetical protein